MLIKIALFVIIGVETVVIAILAFMLVRKMSGQSKMVDKAEMIVKGKLNVEDINSENADANTAVLAKAFNSIKSNLLTFIEATKINVVTLSDAVDVLSDSVEANKRGNESIAESATNVAMKTAEQLELVKDNLSLIESNNSQMQEIDAAIEGIRGILDDTVSNSNDGIASLEGYVRDMETMSDDLNRINEILAQFNNEIKKIGEVGDFIVDISNQLRLLAFNASIEAARAGQFGRGFTVVADEMNVMSGKTKDGMDTINNILKEIVKSSKQVNESISNCENTYNKSKNTFENVNSSFRTINEQANNIQNEMNNISGMFGIMTDNSDKSRDRAESLFDTAQVISENTHEIAAVSEEVAAESTRVGANTDELAGMLEGIRRLLKQFDTAVVPTEKVPYSTVKILVMSMLDNEFWYELRKGVLYAQKELEGKNVEVEYVTFVNDDNLAESVGNAIQSAIDRDFNGIIFPGFLGGADNYFREAAARGIKLMTYNCDCGKQIPRMCCLRPDPHEPGILAAKAADKYLNKRGKVLILMGDEHIDVNVERNEGFRMQIAECKGINIAAQVSVPDNGEEVYRIALEAIKNNPDVGIVYNTNGFPLSVARAIEDTGNKGRMALVGFDQNQEIFSCIKNGLIAATISQDAFGQGHDPLIWLYNYLVTGEPLDEFISCRLSLIDKSNVENLITT